SRDLLESTSFFFQGFRAHGDLHSFPTRRSSDLATFTSALLLDFGAIFGAAMAVDWVFRLNGVGTLFIAEVAGVGSGDAPRYLNPDRKSTRLNSSHLGISYAVFCLKKKKKQQQCP